MANCCWVAGSVTMMLISYGTFALSGFFALGYLVKSLAGREALFGGTPVMTLEQMEGFAYRLVQLGWPLITVGIMLGAVWADTAWGRYWGWDPKENGALLIVIWCAVILHARWGGMVRDRGVALLAIFGNIITAWSWFGVNMLGVGLHSYGFMDSAFKWLVLFVISQVVLIALGLLPLRLWRSFGEDSGNGSSPAPLPAK